MDSFQEGTLLLDTLRHLNRIFAHIRTSDQLLSEVCKTLVSLPQYNSVWIASLKPNNTLGNFSHEGLGKYGKELEKDLSLKNLTHCSEQILKKGGMILVDKDTSTCSGCPLFPDNNHNNSIILSLAAQGMHLGVLSISLSSGYKITRLEEEILLELSDNLGSTLSTLSIGEENIIASRAINILSNSISGNSSEEVLQSFVMNMVKSLDSDFAFIGEFVPGFEDKIKTIAVSTQDSKIDNFEYSLRNTPCSEVINKNSQSHVSDAAKKYPKDQLLQDMNIDEYIGAPLINSKQEVIGIMVVLKKSRFTSERLAKTLFKVFTSRASSELLRFENENLLIENKRLYHDIFEKTKSPIYIIVGKRIVLVNSAWLEMFELTSEDVDSPAFSIHQIVAPESKALMRRRLDNFLSGINQPHRYELKAISKSGKKYVLDVSITRINWRGKRAVLGVYRDITTRNRNERKLQKALEESRKEAQMKTAFLSNLSQKFHISLKQIRESAKSMNLANKNETQDFTNYIANNSSLLLDHLSDIIDLSQIEMGEVSLKLEKFNFYDLLKDVLQYFGPMATNKGIELSCCRKKNNNIQVLADPTRVRQILIIIINNAIKYTDHGKVLINYNARQDDVRISVADTGIGISMDKQQAIFKSFLNPNGKFSGDYDGSFLGLSLTNSLLQLMGGKIWIESNPDGGSIFYFTLPLA